MLLNTGLLSDMKEIFYTLLAGLSVIMAPTLSHACPLVSGLPDFNCDGRFVAAVMGDSLVYGTGDSTNNGKGGYVLRTEQQLVGTTFHNFGEPGATAIQIIFDLERAFDGRGGARLAAGLVEADLIVVDVGRNDRWSMKPPSYTHRNLKRIRTIARDRIKTITGYSPLVVTAVLMLPNRGRQSPWIAILNELLQTSSTAIAPTDLRFDKVSKRLLSADRIHPTSKGYEALTTVFVRYLKSKYPTHVADLRKDKDEDGLYDIFERSHFGTDPLKTDTDGDGLKDGEDSDPLG